MTSQPITGFVLAGGQSRRMGRDKGGIEWGGETLLTHAARRMSDAFPKVIVLGPSASDGFASLRDELPNCGPLGGIYSALGHSQTDWNVFLAVDMPLVPTPLLRFIAAKCELGNLAVVPEVTASDLDGAELGSKSAAKARHNTQACLQPLCAAYHRGFLPLVERALSNRELSIRRLLVQATQGMMDTQADAIRIIPQQELTSAGFTSEMLINVNTPADLECAKGLAERFHVD